MSNTREAIHSAGNASAITLFSGQFIPFLMEYIWILILPLTVVLVDLWFGISESRMSHIEVRFSGAGWKTIRKLIDYYTVLTLGFVIGECLPSSYNISIQELCLYSISPLLLFDICSIVGHYLKLRNINFSLKSLILRVFVSYVKTKNDDFGQALEDGLNKEINQNNK